jgi:hypothetical protein
MTHVCRQDPATGEWVRTFATITTDANEMVADIHDRMPLIIAPSDYARWLGEEPDPHDLMRPFPAEPMRMWPITTRVTSRRTTTRRSSSPSIWQVLLRRHTSALTAVRCRENLPRLGFVRRLKIRAPLRAVFVRLAVNRPSRG